MKTTPLPIITKFGVEVFYTGNSFDQEIKKILSDSLKNKKPIYFLFDLDGTLLESGLETENNPKKINEWVNENQASVKNFQFQIKKLSEKTGILFGICTGRGIEFIRRVNQALFPEGVLGESIVESGIFIYNPATGEKRYPKCMDNKSAALLLEYRARIIKRIIAVNGFSEAGKELALSFNPPERMDIYSFKQKVVSSIVSLENEIYEETGKKEDLINNLEINNSSTAIDITPKGASKSEALRELSENKIIGYFGDAENDISAMGISRINAAPGNSVDNIKNVVRTVNIGLIASGNTIEGVNQILRLIKAGDWVYRKKYHDL